VCCPEAWEYSNANYNVNDDEDEDIDKLYQKKTKVNLKIKKNG
jgi:hypothetical protein